MQGTSINKAAFKCSTVKVSGNAKLMGMENGGLYNNENYQSNGGGWAARIYPAK
jgi:hypothetical protein